MNDMASIRHFTSGLVGARVPGGLGPESLLREPNEPYGGLPGAVLPAVEH